MRGGLMRRRPIHRPSTVNLPLFAPARPAAVALSQHWVHAPVTLKLLNVAMPFTAVTLFVPFKPPTTMGPSSATVTRPPNPVALPPCASNAVTSTEHEPPTHRPPG